ncbi:hypothetical protein [Mucilaginibacter sp.]|jgi:hypothetical protein|uniref:hypothetical protein n=1 Tax=Mucilaginibacter sp. TaxID=1882438 RepID=UPI003568274D
MDLPNKTDLVAILSSSFITGGLSAMIGYYLNKLSYKKNKSHENKILEIKNFYKSYQTLKFGVEDYHNYTMFSKKDLENAKSISIALIPLLHEFQYQSMIIKLFLNESEYLKVIKVEKVLFQIKRDIDIFHITFKDPNSANSGNRMKEIKELDFGQILPELMSSIELSLRKTFN